MVDSGLMLLSFYLLSFILYHSLYHSFYYSFYHIIRSISILYSIDSLSFTLSFTLSFILSYHSFHLYSILFYSIDYHIVNKFPCIIKRNFQSRKFNKLNKMMIGKNPTSYATVVQFKQGENTVWRS